MPEKTLKKSFGKNSLCTTDPDVSVIISVDSSSELLARTINDLNSVAGKTVFETIALVRTEDDELSKYAAQRSDITFINAGSSLPPRICRNYAAKNARGRRLLFITAGIVCTPHAVDALMSAFDQFTMVGLVGALRVAEDGTLLEAGGSLEFDQDLLHLVRSPETTATMSRVLFTRECGFVSGEIVMIDANLFEKLDGYHYYSNKIYADADLCVRARKTGMRVVFESRSLVKDLHDADLAPTLRFTEADREKFLDRHAEWLFGLGSPLPDPLHRENDSYRLRVLYIDDKIPHIDFGAGLPRANSIVNCMASTGYRVTIYPFIGTLEQDVCARYRDLNPTIEVLEPRGRDGLAEIIKSRLGCYDLIWISRPHNIYEAVNTFFECGVAIRQFASRIVFDSEASFAFRNAICSTVKTGFIASDQFFEEIRKETEFAPIADVFVVVSRGEAEIVRAVHGDGVQIRILGHVLPERKSASETNFAERQGVVFLGSLANEEEPNADSMAWFMNNIWPHVIHRDVKAHLTLIGETSRPFREKLEKHGATVLGRLEDISTVLGKFRVGVAPTRFAAGVPHKVHELISFGTPVVATPLLAAQLGWSHGEGVLVAPWQNPEHFAEAVLQMLHDEVTWTDVRNRGLARVSFDCDEATFRKNIKTICE